LGIRIKRENAKEQRTLCKVGGGIVEETKERGTPPFSKYRVALTPLPKALALRLNRDRGNRSCKEKRVRLSGTGELPQPRYQTP